MAEHEQRKSKAANRRRYHVRFALALMIAILIIASGLFYLGLDTPSIEECLAAIEAAEAIPDAQNAAIIYNQLLEDPNTASLVDLPESIDEDSNSRTLLQPWLEKDYPEVAAWIDGYQQLIDKLVEVSQFEKCHFPILVNWYGSKRSTQLSIVRRWAFLLKRASNNDIAEDRNGEAITKCSCLIRLGEHFRQQSILLEYLTGVAIQSLGVNQMALFVMEGNVDENHLQEIELIPLRTHDDWATVMDRLMPVEELTERKFKEQLGLLRRLKYELQYGVFGNMKDRKYEKLRFIHNRMLACSRGIHILIALKRYKNNTGYWPENLDQIRSQVPAEMFVDPLNECSFVYRLTDDSFTLYSKGQNNVDEGGKYISKGPDDWPIWPPRSRISKLKQQGADPNKSDTNL